MSKEVEWGIIHGEGDIVCSCDNCEDEERIEFCDGHPDYREAQREIEIAGWMSSRINNEWYDFCCSSCRNEFVKRNI